MSSHIACLLKLFSSTWLISTLDASVQFELIASERCISVQRSPAKVMRIFRQQNQQLVSNMCKIAFNMWKCDDTIWPVQFWSLQKWITDCINYGSYCFLISITSIVQTSFIRMNAQNNNKSLIDWMIARQSMKRRLCRGTSFFAPNSTGCNLLAPTNTFHKL